MPEKELASVVIESEILTLEEVGDMMKHFSDLPTSSLSFIQAARIPGMGASILLHEV